MSPKPAWKVYTLVVGAMVPTLFVWIFSLTVLFPKVELLWERFGPAAEGREVPVALQYIFSFSRFAFGNFILLVGLPVLAVVLMEIRWKSWARWRATVLVTLTILLNALVMLALVLTTTMALLLATKALVMTSEST
jgi:hypothetical protein